MTTDIILNDDKGYIDFDWTVTGDFSTAETLDTYIFISLFEEQRATPELVPDNRMRRGWIGNESTPDFEQGSLIWTFSQERVTGSMLAELGQVIRNALQKLIDDDLATNVIVDNPKLVDGIIGVVIAIFRDGSEVDRRFFPLWENTPVGG